MDSDSPTSPSRLIVGDWLVSTLEGYVERDGKRRHLRPKSMDVLALLAARPSMTVTRECLVQRVWGGSLVDEASLAKCIAEIRAALGDDAREPRYIETVPRRGYRLIAPAGGGERGTLRGLAGGRFARVVEAGRWGRQRRSLAILAVVLAILAVVVVAGRDRLAPPPHRRVPPVVPSEGSRPAAAIVGLENLSGDPAHDWLQSALAQMLTTELAVGERGRAVPAGVALGAARRHSIASSELTDPATLRHLAAALGATYLVTGSYLVSAEPGAGSLRLDLLVYDGASGEVAEGIVETGRIADLSTLVRAAGSRLRRTMGLGDGPADRPTEAAKALPPASRPSRPH